MIKTARVFAKCSSKSTLSILFLFLVGCLAVLLWKQGVYLKEFLGDQRLLEHRRLSGYNEFRSFYSVRKRGSTAIAWQSVTFDIRPRSTRGLLVGRTAFRGEATNALEMIVLDISHVGGDVYQARFTPSFGGEYNITVLLTYVNGENFNSSSHVAAKMVHIEGSPILVPVESRPPPDDIARYCGQSESGTAPGRWVLCGTLRGIEACGPWQLNPRYDFDKRYGFFWLPYSCQLHYYTNLEMKTCLARNGWENIVFTGDSHSRYRAYHWVTRLYGACVGCGKSNVSTRFDLVPKLEWVFDARGTRWPATFPSITRPTEIYMHPKTRRSHFSYRLPESTDNGDLYFMNFGHWLLRELTFGQFMADKLRAYLEAVKLMNTSMRISRASTSRTIKRKRFLWVNTMSLKWREDEEVRKWTMTPSPSSIAYLNSFIDRAMEDAGVQVVDAFQVSNARLNAVHDATHYAKVFPDEMCGGVVENAVTNLILNSLCSE